MSENPFLTGRFPLIVEKNDDSKREDFMKIPSRGQEGGQEAISINSLRLRISSSKRKLLHGFHEERNSLRRNSCPRIFFDELSSAPLVAEVVARRRRKKFKTEEGNNSGKINYARLQRRQGSRGHFYIIRGQRQHNYHPPRPSCSSLLAPNCQEGKKEAKGNGPVMRCELVFLAASFPCHSLVRFPQRKQPRLIPPRYST